MMAGKTVGPIMAVTRDAADAQAIPAHHQPIAVVLDLLNPERTRRRSGYLRRQARFDEAGGSLHDHGRRMTARAIVVMLPPRAQ